MTHFLFVDESGHDRKASPYEVLAGLAIEDRDLWNLIQAVQQAEIEYFGRRYSQDAQELKAKRLLKAKTFRLAQRADEIPGEERVCLACECLDSGSTATPRHLAALAQAKIAFVQRLLELCTQYHARAFAIIVNKDAPYPADQHMLRKDYAYLFERFFYYLEDVGTNSMGVVVFDELERSRSHLLTNQMYAYFQQTANGRQRAGRVIPEPFFVHSELTTGVQLVDLVAYLVSWGFRGITEMIEPARPELQGMVAQVAALRHQSHRDRMENPNFSIWSFYYIKDLRPSGAREVEQ